MKTATLSVIMANYNHADYIEQALESLLNQSPSPDELIVVDDCSTDGSDAIVADMAKRRPAIRLIRNDRQRGAAFAANRALEAASGRYVFGIGADDMALPGVLAKSLEQLARHPEAALCCSYPATFDHASGRIQDNAVPWSDTARYFSPEELADVIAGGYIAGHTCVGKREVLLKAGGFIEALRWHSDWFMWHVAAFRHGICFIPESLSAIRVLPQSYSNAGRRDWSQQQDVLYHLLDLLNSPDYRDVLPQFARAELMLHFGDEIVRAVMACPERWEPVTQMLIQANLWRWNHQQVRRRKAQDRQRLLINARLSSQRGDVDRALERYTALTQLYPKDPQSHAMLAHAALNGRRLGVARQSIDRALALAPANADLLNLSGMIHVRSSRHDQAEICFQRALAADPAHVNAIINLAEINRRKGLSDAARRQYRQALRLAPGNAQIEARLRQLAPVS